VKILSIYCDSFSSYKLQPYKKIYLFKNYWKILIRLQRYSLCHWKPPLKFEIEVSFRQVVLYNTYKNKNITHIILKSIHSSFRSESQIREKHEWNVLSMIKYFIFCVLKNLIIIVFTNVYSKRIGSRRKGFLCLFVSHLFYLLGHAFPYYVNQKD